MDPDFLHAINGDWDALLTAMRENRQVAQRTDASGMTVLHWVCLHQDTPTDIVVKVVFANPYAVHMRNDAGHLPIDLAVQAECGERILEVLRAAYNGSRRADNDDGHGALQQHDLLGPGDGGKDEEPATETIDYQLPYNNHTILQDDRNDMGYQPQQLQRYYNQDEEDEEDEEDGVDDDELDYQRHHRHYQQQPYQQPRQQPERGNGRDLRSDSNQDSERMFYGQEPPANGMYGSYGAGRGRNDSLPRSEQHLKSLALTEQRLRERENDLISIATADDTAPLGMFDPSKAPDLSLMSSFQVPEEVKSGNGNGASQGAGPRGKAAFPPRWKQARMCHVCASGFSLMKRRHHCRNCGQSVCGQHSTNRVALPKFALTEPQRVCDRCFLSGHHIMVAAQSAPSVAGSYQSLPAQFQSQREPPHPFQTQQQYEMQQYQMQYQHAR
ncbi:hypothetical protein BBJ28_00010850 [Nothophytophthora sp. Chile5]|nr:hypothetical protein BBJ28_00010850 [Nothophytophthora sp. Chile5]